MEKNNICSEFTRPKNLQNQVILLIKNIFSTSPSLEENGQITTLFTTVNLVVTDNND